MTADDVSRQGRDQSGCTGNCWSHAPADEVCDWCREHRFHMGPEGRSQSSDDVPTFEELLSNPHLSFDLGSEVLPHLLAFGAVKDCLTCRPGIYCPTHTPTGTAPGVASGGGVGRRGAPS